jgi:hypothetical protein
LIPLTLLKNKKTKLHRGKILSAAVKQSRYTKVNAAKRANYSRSSYYKHIADPDLDFDILARYGKAIGYDFTEEFPEMPKYIVEEPQESYQQPLTIEQLIRDRDHWKDKYVELLERYNRQIEERMEKK